MPVGETVAPSSSGTPPFSTECGERGQGGEGYRHLLAFLLLLFLFSIATPTHAYETPSTILVLVSGATLDDLKPGGRLPAVRELAERGGVSLLHNRVWGDFNENAAYLSVGSSERMAAPATNTPSFEELRRFQPNVADRPEKVGALGRALVGHTVILEDHSPPLGSLVVGEAVAKSSSRKYLRVIVARSIGECDVIVKRLMAGDPSGYPAIIVASPYTPEIEGGAPYRRLGFVVWLRVNVRPGSLLQSPTTRTPGLVANVDLAPTIATDGRYSVPGAVGGAITPLPHRFLPVWTTLDALDRQTNAAARATTPVLAGYGIFAGISCLFALAALRPPFQKSRSVARFVLLVAASVLPALLAVGILAPQTPLAYGLALSGIALAIAAFAQRVAPQFTIPPLNLVFYALVGTIVADAFLHAHLVERSLLSAATLTGIRFYGIGNEWLGLLLGAAVVSLVPWWLGALVVCAVGLPYFGADAGGTLAAVTAFAVLYLAKRTGEWKPWHIGAGFTLAVVVTGAFAVLDRLQPGAARSHVGAAIATGESPSGVSRLTDLAMRKIAMNASLFLSPWTLLTIVVMIAIGFGLRRIPLSAVSPALSQLRSTIIPAVLSGAIVAFLFNDGGVAAGLLLLVPLLVSFLDTLLSGNMASVVSE